MKHFTPPKWIVMVFAVMVAMTFGALPVAADFYDKPATMPGGSHGDLVKYEPTDLIIPDAPEFDAWKVMYLSTNAKGEPNLVTGVVAIPTAAWEGGGTRPVVSHCPGTQGMGPYCSSSYQLEMGNCYQAGNAAAILNEGYAMVMTDYPGYLTRENPEVISDEYPAYMNRNSEAHAVLDIIKAARQIPGSPMTASDRVAIWGFSQGGQAACAAGEDQPTYMPGLNLVTVAAGGVPSDLMAVAYNVDGKVGSGFLMQVFVALAAEYPEQMPIYDLMNDMAEDLIMYYKDTCMFESLFGLMYYATSDLSEGNLSLEVLFEQQEEIAAIAEGMKLGSKAINAPVYMYHGTSDPYIPLEQALDLKDNYCALGVQTTFDVFPNTEHVTVMYQGTPYVMNWLKDRFNNEPLDEDIMCQTLERPIANPYDPAGDYIIPMDNWTLSGWVGLGNLNQTVPLPEDATFTALDNVTQLRVDGDVNIPKFQASINILLPIKANMQITPAEPMSADLFVGNSGELEIHGNTLQNLKVTSIGLTRLAWLPFSARTSEPVDFPLDFVGTVQDLGLGKIKFTGETTVPRMTGSLVAPIFSLIMSGPMPFEYNVGPGPNQEPILY